MTLAERVEELCAMLANERDAIAKLDHLRVAELAIRKVELVGEVMRLAERTPEARALIERIRIEAQANAMLARTASEAIRALLGYERGGYNRNAEYTTSRVPRFVAAI
jgi:hypothetical protein